MHGADLVSGEVFVVCSLETESDGSLIARVDTELRRGGTPGQFLVCDLVVAPILNDVVEDLQKVEVAVSHPGLGIKFGAAFRVEGFELVDEGLVLGGAIDGVLWDGFLRRHRGR